VDGDEFERRFTRDVASFPRPVQRRLLDIPDLPDTDRPAEIGRLYQDSSLIGIAEFLIYLEEEPAIRKLVAAH
jgi:hypothetical protein